MWEINPEEKMEIAITIIVSVFVLFILYLFILARPRLSMNRQFRENDKELFTDYAHRGLHGDGIPENSLAAFAKAVENGHGLELDVQLSADGKVMVFHDDTLKRMTGCDKMLCELTAEELRKLRLAGTDEKIPYLTEVLDLVDGRSPILVELKGETLDTSVCDATYEILKDYKGSYCVESFNPILLRWFKKHAKSVMRGLLVTKMTKETEKHKKGYFLLRSQMLNFISRPDFISYDVRYPGFALDLCTKFFGATPYAWTIRNEDAYYKAREYGAFVIFEHIKPEIKDLLR